MYSLNVPVPAEVARLAATVARELPNARARTRGEHTLVVKRLTSDRSGTTGGSADRVTYDRLETRAREVLHGQPPFEIRIDGVDYFAEPATGTAPVVYLSVASGELESLHDRLAGTFEPVDGLEGDEYVPHVTVARGGAIETARRVADREIDPITWTVSQLVFWDGEHNQPISTLSLPA